MELMNNLSLNFASIESAFGIDFKTHFAKELSELEPFEKANLLKVNSEGIFTTPTGGMLIRNIAMLFDAYLYKNVGKDTFSKTI